jgi:hypothetical protein
MIVCLEEWKNDGAERPELARTFPSHVHRQARRTCCRKKTDAHHFSSLDPRTRAFEARLTKLHPHEITYERGVSTVDRRDPRVERLAPTFDTLAPTFDTLAPTFETLASTFETLAPTFQAGARKVDARDPPFDRPA